MMLQTPQVYVVQFWRHLYLVLLWMFFIICFLVIFGCQIGFESIHSIVMFSSNISVLTFLTSLVAFGSSSKNVTHFGAGGVMVPSDFGRSVFSIATRIGRSGPQFSVGSPRFSALPPSTRIIGFFSLKKWSSFFNSFFNSFFIVMLLGFAIFLSDFFTR